MKSVMQHNFGKIESPERPRSSFDMSHGRKLTFDAGKLIPIAVEEVLPGDTWNWRATLFGRFSSSLNFPIMDNVFLDTFWFYVPYRLLWTNWERMNGAQVTTDPISPTEYEVPHIIPDSETDSFFALGLADYFGLPTDVAIATGDEPSALPFRAYNLIWNEWFRDQNMQDPVAFNTDDGPDDITDYQILNRGKRYDYFTGCLPFAQKGDAITISLGTSAPVIGNGKTTNWTDGTYEYGMYANATQSELRALTGNENTDVGTTRFVGNSFANNFRLGLSEVAANSGMIADLTSAAGIPINDLRQAIAYQQILELDARGGTRYTEHLQVTWGVQPQDSRLQRPEYLGGSSQRMNINSVAQTTANPASPTIKDAKGALGAYATMESRHAGFMKSFPEHGVIIGLVNVRADLTYQQGMRRMWSRRTRFDFAHPKLAHIGEQAVLNKEIFYPDLGTNANAVFGYQERFAEYRFIPSQVVAEFRSNYATPLDAWHLAIDFPSIPPLDASFIEDAPPINRVLAVTSQNQIIMDSYHSVRCARVLPTYGTPGLMRL